MLTEQYGKAGCLCQPARAGKLRCPLIVRATSEDVVTGNLFGTLSALNHRWWLPDLLNEALGTSRFRRQVFSRLRIELWRRQRKYPAEHLRWAEGATEVDVEISWENPPTTVFVEMKYGAPLSKDTVHNDGMIGYPSDQLIRNARIGLRECGWFREDLLFDAPQRDFVLLLVTPSDHNPLVTRYRDVERLRKSIPDGHRLQTLPQTPFVGELSYFGIVKLLRSQQKYFNRAERKLVEQLNAYLEFKLAQLRDR